MGRVRGRVKPGSKIWAPEPPMPWSLGLPIFDEEKGKYVSRDPVREPETPDPDIHDEYKIWTPLDRGYDAHMRKKEASLKKRVQRAKAASMKKERCEEAGHIPAKASSAGKKREKKCFWEKPKPRRRGKVLSIRGERV